MNTIISRLQVERLRPVQPYGVGVLRAEGRAWGEEGELRDFISDAAARFDALINEITA